MKLSDDEIQLALTQADDFMQINGASRQKRIWYSFFLESILLDYQALYGEETAFQMKFTRRWQHVYVAVCVRCEKNDLLKNNVNRLSRKLSEQNERNLTWKYAHGENIITYTYFTHMQDFRSIRYVWQYMRDEKHTFAWAERFNPWKLNEKLIGCGAFSPAADLDLRRVEGLYPIRYCGSTPYSREVLYQFVKEGRVCLITVSGTLGPKHFLCLDRLTEEDAVVIDPKCGTALLSQYSCVCEIRSFHCRTGVTA